VSDVFQEVDEELKRQQLDKAFRLYGPWVIALVLIVVGGYAGFNFWQDQKDRAAGAAGDQLITAMETLIGGDEEAAAVLFANLADTGPGGYAMLARMQEAAAKRKAGDSASALALYDAVASSGNTPALYQDLARFYGGLTALEAEGVSLEDTLGRLELVADGTSPWRFHAREAMGFAAYRSGSFETAATHYQRLTDDPTTPAGVASRATEMLNLTQAATE